QAAACADANVTLISPFVGRILDWYKAFEKKDSYAIEQDPGVVSVKQIYNYYKQHGISTQVMGASFRSTEQVLALAGCDLLTIAPALLDQLKSSTVKVSPQLSKQLAQSADVMPKLTLDAQRFDAMMNNDQMAFELLQSGVDGFIKAREQLSQRLRKSFGI
ncbi:transaldolase family protein, partial [Rhizobium hidalgonense]